MTEPQLSGRLDAKVCELRRSVDALPESDSLKKWFQFELHSHCAAGDGDLDMSELNARMRSVTQLSFLVQEHRKQIGAPDHTEAARQLDESLHTLLARLPSEVGASARATGFSIEPAILLAEAHECAGFDAVSVTAKVVGYLRGLDEGLAFARDLSFATEAKASLDALGLSDPDTQARMAVLFQARYHGINAAIAQTRAPQVLEIASGISPRGLQWSRSNPGTVYIESDLPILMREKAKTLRNLIQSDIRLRRGVLHCCGIDALDLKSLRHALAYTDPDSDLVIVTEGLLLYFDADEMGAFLDNMRTILAEHPQAKWVVDMVSRANLEELCQSDAAVAAAVRKIFCETGRSVIGANPFQSTSCIERCLDEHGLRAESRLPLSEMTSVLPISGGVSRERMRAIVGSRALWTVVAA